MSALRSLNGYVLLFIFTLLLSWDAHALTTADEFKQKLMDLAYVFVPAAIVIGIIMFSEFRRRSLLDRSEKKHDG